MSHSRNPLKQLVRSYIEGKLKNALRKQHLSDFHAWLTIAEGQNDPNRLLKFQFTNGKTLTEYAIAESNQLLKKYYAYQRKAPWYQRLWFAVRLTSAEKQYLFPAQTYAKNLLLLENAIANKPSPTLNLWQRFINWSRNTLAINYPFDAQAITLEKAAADIYETGIKLTESPTVESKVKKPNFPTTLEKRHLTESLSEHHTPAEILIDAKLIKRRLNIETPQNPLPQPKTPEPTHLSHWLNQSQLTNVTVLDQLQQQMQVQQLNQSLNIEDEKKLAPVQTLAKKYLDNSATIELYSFKKSVENSKFYDWLSNFIREASKVYSAEWRGRQVEFKISQSAQEILTLGQNDFYFSYQEDIDLDKLPLGFFIERENIGARKETLALKFSHELREVQLKDPLANLDLDPAAIVNNVNKNKNDEKQEPLEILQNRLHDELKKQNINLDFEPLQIVLRYAVNEAPQDVTASHGGKESRYKTLLPSLYKQLHAILLQSGREHFLALLIHIAKLHEVSSKHHSTWLDGYTYGFQSKECTLLDNFLGAYFPDDASIADLIGEELSQPNILKILNDLASPENTMAQKIFAAIINKNATSLNKAYHAAMTAQNHFKELNIAISDDLSKYLACSGFRYLSKIINLSSASNLPALQTTLALANETPGNYVFCNRLLNQGYSIVVACMDIGYYSDYVKTSLGSFSEKNWNFANVPMIVSDRQLRQTYWGSYPIIDPGPERTHIYNKNPYFAMWFRYLAYQVDPRYVAQAIEKWRKLMGQDSLVTTQENYERDKKNLEKHWVTLRDYVLGLPKKLDSKNISEEQLGYAEVKQDTGLVNEKSKANLKKIERDLQQYSLEAATKLCTDTIKLNSDDTQFIHESLQGLNNLADQFKDLSSTALLEKSNALRNLKVAFNPKQLIEALAILRELNYRWTTANSKTIPPQGEWLRMEQAVVILLGSTLPAKLFQVDTSEGKTLIIGLTAMLQAMQNRKIDILTHNENFATEAFDKIQYLSQILELKVAEKKSARKDRLTADILCIDISSAVINHTLDKYEGQVIRQADIAYSDEIDNQIDIQAKTTMQISSAVADSPQNKKDFELFLVELSIAVKNLKERPDINTPKQQFDFVKTKLSECKSYDDDSLPFWIAATVRAQQLQINEDYIVEDDRIRIVHHTTTGRVDRESIWGEGVHQCVAAQQRTNNPNIIIEPMSEIVAEGNIASYYSSNYKARYGFTGTLGDPVFKQKIAEILQTEQTVIMPRAARPDLKEANWPLIADDKGELHKQFNRAYHYAPIIKDTQAEHTQTLIEMICKVRQENQSMVLFFNTIAQCEEFYKILQYTDGRGKAQIFDDTSRAGEEEQKEGELKISQKTAILHAASPGMITLTTAAGSRGVDFHSVSVGAIATPSLARVIDQKAGRIGRNAQFGIVYEIYHLQQLDETARKTLEKNDTKINSKKKPNAEQKENKYEQSNLRIGLDLMEAKMQQADLNLLNARQPLDQFKHKVQNEYFAMEYKSTKWGPFFAKITDSNKINELERDWAVVKDSIQQEKTMMAHRH